MSVQFTAATDEVVFVDTAGDVTFSATSGDVVFTAAVAGPQGPAGAAGTSDHSALSNLEVGDPHPQYARSVEVEFVTGGTTLTGTPRVVNVLSAGTVTLPATVSSTSYGREWRIVNVAGAAITLDAGSSGLLFSGVSQTLTVAAGRLLSILPLDLAGIGTLYGLQLLTPVGAVGGAIGAADVVAGTGITATPAGDGSSVTVAVGSLPSSAITSGTLDVARIPVGTTSSTVAAGDDGRFDRPPALFASDLYSATASTSQGNSGPTNNRLYYVPLYVPRSVTVTRMAIHHTGSLSGGAGSVARLGIYTSSGDLPGDLVLDAGTVDVSTAPAFKEITGLTQALAPGLYWIAAVVQLTSGSAVFLSGTPTLTVPDQVSTFTGTKFQNGVTGTLPSTASPGSANATQPPVMFVRVA